MKKFIYLHQFFVKESKSYVGVKKGDRYEYEFKDILYFPIAYIKFMYYSFKK